MGSNAEELPLTHTVSDNLPSQSLDPGTLYMIKKRHNKEKMIKDRTKSDLISHFLCSSTDSWNNYCPKAQHEPEQTWWGAEGEPTFEAPLSRKNSWTVSVTQKRFRSNLWLLNATKIIHRHQEVLLVVHLSIERRLTFLTFLINWHVSFHHNTLNYNERSTGSIKQKQNSVSAMFVFLHDYREIIFHWRINQVKIAVITTKNKQNKNHNLDRNMAARECQNWQESLIPWWRLQAWWKWAQ